MLCPWRKTLYPLLSTGSIQEDLSQHDCKIVDWYLMNQMNKNLARVKNGFFLTMTYKEFTAYKFCEGSAVAQR